MQLYSENIFRHWKPAGIWYISLITISCTVMCIGVKNVVIISVYNRCDCIIFFRKKSHFSWCTKTFYQNINRYASITCFDTQQIYTENNLFVKLRLLIKSTSLQCNCLCPMRFNFFFIHYLIIYSLFITVKIYSCTTVRVCILYVGSIM